MKFRNPFKKKTPTLTWDDITIGQFMSIDSIIKSEKEELEKTYQIYQVITGKDGRTIPFAEFKSNLEPIEKLLYSPLPQRKLQKSYDINGTTYYPQIEANRLTTSQYFDYNNSDKDDYVQLLSILLVPKGHVYNDGYSLSEVKEDIRNHFSIVHFNSLIFFFKAKLKKLSMYFLGYSSIEILKLKALTWKQKKDLIRAIKVTLPNMES